MLVTLSSIESFSGTSSPLPTVPSGDGKNEATPGLRTCAVTAVIEKYPILILKEREDAIPHEHTAAFGSLLLPKTFLWEFIIHGSYQPMINEAVKLVNIESGSVMDRGRSLVDVKRG